MSAISEELLENFLKGLCTEEEAEIVEAHFQEHPEDVFLLDQYEAEDGMSSLPEGYTETMLAAIVAETAGGEKFASGTVGDSAGLGDAVGLGVRRASAPEVLGEQERAGDGGRVRVMWAWAAAACMLLLVGSWWMLLGKTKKEKENAPAQLAAVWVGKHNADNKKIRVQLPDSSEMVLSPDATIRYRKDFGQYGLREVHVEGQATFTVIKDKEIPFIVYSGGLRTAVLGTIFEVTAEKNSDQIRVRLLEGNVIVGLDSLVKDSTRKYFLSPGEEFIYGKWNKSVLIQKIKPFGGGGYAVSRVNRLPAHPDSLSNWYMFNNQALADVFDQLSILYNIDIQYSSEDLRNKYFIGKLEKKDSLSKIIRDIALLNHLSVTVLDGHYIVRKRK